MYPRNAAYSDDIDFTPTTLKVGTPAMYGVNSYLQLTTGTITTNSYLVLNVTGNFFHFLVKNQRSTHLLPRRPYRSICHRYRNHLAILRLLYRHLYLHRLARDSMRHLHGSMQLRRRQLQR